MCSDFTNQHLVVSMIIIPRVVLKIKKVYCVKIINIYNGPYSGSIVHTPHPFEGWVRVRGGKGCTKGAP